MEIYQRDKSHGNGHYEGTCNFCGKKWSRGKPTSLRAHIANHCTSTNIPADVKSYFIKILANENEKKKEYSDSESESNQNNENIKRQKIANNRKSSIGFGSTNINNHFQKKEKLNSNRVKEIDCGLVQAFVCCGIPLWVIENPAMINLIKSLNANYLINILLKNEVAKVNAKVDRIIENSENLTIGKYLLFITCKYILKNIL